MLQPVTFTTVKQRTIVIIGETPTFGGARAKPIHVVSRPSIKMPVGVAITDSYGVPTISASGGYHTPLNFVAQALLKLGFLPHQSSVGGTGFLADNGAPASYYNFKQRLPYEVDPYFDTGNQLGVMPGVILAPGSQNDGNSALDGAPGSATLDTAIRQTFDTLQANYPGVPIFTSPAERAYRGNSANNANDVLVAAQMLTAATTTAAGGARVESITVLDPCGNGVGVTGIAALLFGTGYQGATTGDGPADLLWWTDASHPNREGARWLAHYWSQAIAGAHYYAALT
jgi:hypothetical protein